MKALFIFGFVLTLLPLLIWFERKGSAFIQDRAGPNRAGIFGIRLAGIVHNISDVVKLLMKEMMIPPQVNRTYFMIAPILGFTFILTAFAVIPWADHFVVGGRDVSMQVADMNCGILYILAITSLNVFGIVLAGWSSNNKFALMGGLRSTAQMISYEIPLGLALVGIFMVYQSAQLNEIVRGQGQLLFGVPAALGRVRAAAGRDSLHRGRLRGDQPQPVRSSRRRVGDRGRLSRRVQRHALRAFLHGRVRRHRAFFRDDHDAFLRRLADPVLSDRPHRCRRGRLGSK